MAACESVQAYGKDVMVCVLDFRVTEEIEKFRTNAGHKGVKGCLARRRESCFKDLTVWTCLPGR